MFCVSDIGTVSRFCLFYIKLLTKQSQFNGTGCTVFMLIMANFNVKPFLHGGNAGERSVESSVQENRKTEVQLWR